MIQSSATSPMPNRKPENEKGSKEESTKLL